MFKWAVPVVVGVGVVAAAVAHGSLTGRWRPLLPLDGFTARLADVPKQVPGWAGEDVPLADAEDLPRAGIAGHLHRRYTRGGTSDAVTVLIVCGRPGPISVHTPDVCYRSAGYTAVGDIDAPAVLVGARPVPCQRLRFRPPAGRVGAGDLEIRWAWSGSAGVSAPANPRIAFAGEPALYKLYVIRETGAGKPAADPSEQFLSTFIPALEDALRPAR